MSQSWRECRPRFVSLKLPKIQYCVEVPTSEASGLLAAVTQVFRRVWLLALIAVGFLIPASAQTTVFNCSSFTTGGSGSCDYGISGTTGGWMTGESNPYVTNGQALLLPFNQGHGGFNMNYKNAVNVQAFTTTFQFSPDGQNIAFVIQNNTGTSCCGDYPGSDPTGNGQFFSAGAGREAGFYQGFATEPATSNRLAAIVLDQGSWLTYGGCYCFSGSSVQLYQTWMSPSDPNIGASWWVSPDKIATTPVQLNYPSTTQNTAYGPRYTASQSGTTLRVTAVASGTLAVGQQAFPYGNPNTNTQIITAQTSGTTGGVGTYTVSQSQTLASTSFWGVDVFSATISYDGTRLNICLFDVTAANGTCNSTGTGGAGTYFKYTWSAVDIPALVAGNTAWVGFSGGSDVQPLPGDLVYSWSYTVDSAPSTPSLSTYIANDQTWTNGPTPAANPTASPVAGSYSGTQSVSLTSSTGDYICYWLGTPTSTTIYPSTDNYGQSGAQCPSGTLYTSPISVSSTSTLVAIAGFNHNHYSANATAPCTQSGGCGGAPSSMVSFTYSISGSGAAARASTPAFSPAAGSYTSAQSVTLSDATSGATSYYTTNGSTPTTSSAKYTGPITVSSAETLQAIAVATGYSNSAVASAAYAITASLPSIATPAFSPAAGAYTSAQSVSISDATSGATIYYTTNGSTPTTSSAKYTSPVMVSSTETLKAMSAHSGDTDSAVASAAYSIGSISPDSGNVLVIDYPSGFASHPSQVWMGSNSTYSGSSIELTESRFNEANNAWYKTPVNVQAFTTTFTWNTACPAKPTQCGDGIGFMIISSSNPSSEGFNYSGAEGGQLSWSRCYGTTDCPPMKSILVKFDLYNNSTGLDGVNLTGFYSGGVYPQPPQPEYDMAPSDINIQSGHLMKATLTYNGTVLMESVTDTITGATYRTSYSANIPALVGGNTALVGFGGGSGSAAVTQNIHSWTYTVETPPN